MKERVDDFKEGNLIVDFNLNYNDAGGGLVSERNRKPYFERKEILEDIISKVNQELDKDQSYKDFKAELESLRKKAESLSSRLSKYIEKYISTVDI